jgi:L-asparaginase
MVGPGTLPSQGTDRMDMVRYRKSGRARLTGRELLASIPEISEKVEVEVDDANPYGIYSYEDYRRIALRAGEVLARPDVHGLVFVQGTNSLEETAYFLNLTVRSSKPVVLTGAQRPFTALSSDAQLNLVDAIRVCAHPESQGKGVLVVANGEINPARDVSKTSTYRLQTFQSRDLGALGYADADAVIYYRSPTRRHTAASEFDVRDMPVVPRVDVLFVSALGRPGMAEAAVALGAKGLVIAGAGAGSCGNLEEEVAAIAMERRAVVVRASRVGAGRVIRDDGWQRPSMVAADNLLPQKAAVLLSLALANTDDPEEIQRIFREY